MYNLKRLRDSFGVSRTLLSRITDIPYRTLQNWELGSRQMAEYEYKNISYRLSEREALLRVIMQQSIITGRDDCLAEWFSDKNGYGCLITMKNKKYKEYCDVTVNYDALYVVPVWAKWTVEHLVKELEWKDVSEREYI